MDGGALDYLFAKDKLPKGWSYPLRRSVLNVALEAAGVTRLFSVRFSYGGGTQLVRPLRVQFGGDQPRRLPGGTASITVYAVPSAERRSSMAALESKLAIVCDWIRGAETAPPTWRMFSHELIVELHDGQACVVELG